MKKFVGYSVRTQSPWVPRQMWRNPIQSIGISIDQLRVPHWERQSAWATAEWSRFF